MKGYIMNTHQYVLNESFKALLDSIFSDKEAATKLKKAFEEVVNDRATTQAIRLDRLKEEAIQEIRNELLTKGVFESELKATKEVLQSELKAIESKLESEIVEATNNLRDELKSELATKDFVRAEIAEAKQE